MKHKTRALGEVKRFNLKEGTFTDARLSVPIVTGGQ